MSTEFSKITALERPSQAVQALGMGDLDGAWRAMLTPQTLTQDQRNQLGKKLGLDDGVFAPIFRMVTNPILIGSLILSYKFPIPTADNLFKVAERVNGLTGKLPLLGRLASKDSIFRGSEIPGHLDEVEALVLGFKQKYGQAWAEAINGYQAATGRMPTEKELILVGAKLDGLDKAVRGFQGKTMGGKKGVVRIGSGPTQVELEAPKALFPNLDGRMSPALKEMTARFRGGLDEAWKDVFGDVEGRKKILQALARQRKAGFADDFTDVVEEGLRNPRMMPDYFPHRILQSEQDFAHLVKAMTAGSSRRFAMAAQKKASSWASPEVMKRKFGMLPDETQLRKVADYIDPVEKAKLDAIVKARVLHKARMAGVRPNIIEKMRAESLDDIQQNYPQWMQQPEAEAFAGALMDFKPQSYSLQAADVLNSYTHTLAGTYAWTVKGMGDKLMSSMDQLRAAAQTGNAYAKVRLDMMENNYLPMAMGRTNFQQSIRAQAWAQSMAEIGAKMDNPKVRGLLGDKLADNLKGHLENSKGAFSLMNIGRKTAGYFYLSTLGGNVGSVLTNISQNLLTLGPMVGYRTAGEGFMEAMRKSHKYFALRMGPRRMDHETALLEAYPTFRQAGLASSPITDEVISNTLKNAAGLQSLPAAGVKLSERISRALMAMFTASETANRIGAFEAGLIHARRARMGPDDAIRFAAELSKRSHFVTGATSGPYAFLGANPAVKQFMYFPTRMLDFATSHAITMGGAEKNFMGYNPGTFARMIAGSIMALELGDAMGTDMRSRLLGAALPTFQAPKEGSVFGALPIVPPFFQLAGSVGVGISTGEWKEAMHSTPLLIPGGVQIMKVAGLIPSGVPGSDTGQAVAKLFSRTYADYHQPAPDGRIAVYSGKDTFRGYYTPWDLFKQGVGIRGGDLDKEGQVLYAISKQRDEITGLRRAYVDAHFKNDKRRAEQIAREFKSRFNFDIPVTEADMKAMQVRRTVTRLEQLIRTTPAGPIREGLIEAVSATFGEASDSLLGVDPQLLGQPRPEVNAQRFGAQSGSRAGGSTRQRFDARRDLGPHRELDPQRIGRQPGMTNLQPTP